MSDVDDVNERALAAFGPWLNSLAADAGLLADVVDDTSAADELRAPLAGALNYLFKSLDLIDDGIEGLGFLDDAFIVRIAAKNARAAGTLPEGVESLANEAGLVGELLGELGPRLESFVQGLESGTVRGRSVKAILSESETREAMLGDVRAWANRYQAPKFVLDANTLVKLRSFLAAKLPA